jgi:hypothetical protein
MCDVDQRLRPLADRLAMQIGDAELSNNAVNQSAREATPLGIRCLPLATHFPLRVLLQLWQGAQDGVISVTNRMDHNVDGIVAACILMKTMD